MKATALIVFASSYPEHFEVQNGNVQAFYLGPSHTTGDIFVYFPKERGLDAGSILKEQLGNMARADVKEYPKTLHKLLALHLGIDTIISGHWSPVHGPELVEQYLQLLEMSSPPRPIRYERHGRDARNSGAVIASTLLVHLRQ